MLITFDRYVGHDNLITRAACRPFYSHNVKSKENNILALSQRIAMYSFYWPGYERVNYYLKRVRLTLPLPLTITSGRYILDHYILPRALILTPRHTNSPAEQSLSSL